MIMPMVYCEVFFVDVFVIIALLTCSQDECKIDCGPCLSVLIDHSSWSTINSAHAVTTCEGLHHIHLDNPGHDVTLEITRFLDYEPHCLDHDVKYTICIPTHNTIPYNLDNPDHKFSTATGISWWQLIDVLLWIILCCFVCHCCISNLFWLALTRLWYKMNGW